MTLPNTSPSDDRDVNDTREVGLSHAQPPAPGSVAAASASSTMPLRMAARRRVWTVVAIVLVAIVTILAFGALIWQALQPL